MKFAEQYERWQNDCLTEFNRKFGEQRTLHTAPDNDYDPGELVEFGEDGTAYPHGIWGTNFIPKAVTPWNQSPHYVE